MAESSKIRWIPLESNPEIFNKYMHNLGVPYEYIFVDIYGLDDELLMMVPQPVLAITLLYPLNEKAASVDFGEEQEKTDLYFTKQTISNACGTVALIHALANNKDTIKFDDAKHFIKFLNATASLTPEDRAVHLEADQEMGSSHADSAQEGASEAVIDKKLNPHFITFAHKDGVLYELDGRRTCPIDHGKTSADTFLKDAAKIAKKFMERDPDNVNFNLMALVKD